MGTELSRPIWLGMIYDKNHIEQQCDPLYRCDLRRKWNWVIMTDWTRCGLWGKPIRTKTWLIVQVWSTLKTKLSYRDRSNQVQFVMKTRHNNIVTERTGVVYAEKDIELSWLTDRVRSMTKTKQDNDVTERTGEVYTKKQHWIGVTDETRCRLWRKRYMTTMW